MVECPRFIYPFARKLIYDISRDGGYPPINLDIIDFEQLYKENYH
jgi:preprotein translocase subunit SecB